MLEKHAYLIVAHNNWNILNKLLMMLDDKRNDIFLLVDSKSKDFNPEELYAGKFSEISLLNRKNVFWADYSQVSTWLYMLSNVFKHEMQINQNHNNNPSIHSSCIWGGGNELRYKYIHFMTGACLPLKTQSYIHEFCNNSGKEFIGIVPCEYKYCTERTKVYWYFLGNKYFRKYKSLKALSYMLAYIQRVAGINRLAKSKYHIYNGWANCSITHDFASYLLDNAELIDTMFKRTLAPDELWVHTMAYNSKFRERIYDTTDLKNGSMRYIDWQRGKPYTWGQDDGDFEELINSPYLFARKFDENINMDIVNKIYKKVKNNL